MLAGGTDLFPAHQEQSLRGKIIDISRVQGMQGVRVAGDMIEIGGRTTWSEIVKAKLLLGFDGLKEAAREVGSVQIQNQGTVAGNICNASPAADGVTALMALDAEVTLASVKGERSLPLTEFIQGNRKTQKRADELLVMVRIPRRLENAVSTFLKLGARRYLVISIVMVAVNLLPDAEGIIQEARVCVGSCAPRSMRLLELENTLVGRTAGSGLNRILRAHHFAELSPIDDVRATAEYRREAAQTLVGRALQVCDEKVARG